MPEYAEIVDRLVTQFEIAWSSSSRPWISEFVQPLSDEIKIAAIRRLVPIDISQRLRIGEAPQAAEYFQLGDEAVQLATLELNHEPSLNGSSNSIDTVIHQEANETGPSLFANESGFELVGQNDKPSTKDIFDQVTVFNSEGQRVERGLELRVSDRIGRYELIKKIGTGGMGAVWEAQQLEPVERRVAIKLIRSDMATRGAISRFELERKAIALMKHQNIAKILDAGETSNGNPFFVMEIVDGIPLDKYCDQKRLGIRERLRLMIPICTAIQHAHQKGIVHRDLKHSNVLVEEYDGKPVPKIIDFGLAKALEHQDFSDASVHTEIGKIVGTFEYMSPEQADGVGQDVDTRCDIYSLGVMVYKLLTGTTPFQRSQVTNKSLVGLLEHLKKFEPVSPSVRFATFETELAKSYCELRSTTPEKLRQAIHGDLDWIVMKGIDKDRERRYESANNMADDIQRYLDDEEVLARPPTSVYRVSKFVKRNKGLVRSLVSIGLILILGVFGTSYGLLLALKEKDRANQKSEEALRLADEAVEAERKARMSENEARTSQRKSAAQLRATKVKSAWSDWRLGNVEAAWETLNSLSNSTAWENRFLRSEFFSSEKVLYGHASRVLVSEMAPCRLMVASIGQDRVIKIWDTSSGRQLRSFDIDGSPMLARFSGDSKSLYFADLENRVSCIDLRTGKIVTLARFDSDVVDMRLASSGSRMFVSLDASDRKFVGRAKVLDKLITPRIVALSLEVNRQDDVISLERTARKILVSDGENVIVTTDQNDLVVWRKNPEGSYVAAQRLAKHSNLVTDMDWDERENRLVSCSLDKSVRLWDLETGEELQTLYGHTDEVNSIAISPSGKRIASASVDRTAIVWELGGGEVLTCQGHYDSLNDVAFVDEKQIITGADDKTVRIWDAQHKRNTFENQPHSNVVWMATFLEKDTVASVSEDGKIVIHDIQTGNIKHSFDVGTPVLSLVYAPKLNSIIAGDADNRIHIIDVDTFQTTNSFAAHSSYIWDVSLSPNGEHLITSSSDFTAKIWDTEHWSLLHHLKGHEGEVASARYSSDGNWIVTASDDGTIRLWETDNYQTYKVLRGHNDSVWRAVFSPDGSKIASSGHDGEIFIWDHETGDVDLQFKGHSDQIAGLTFSNDGQRLVTASDDATIKIWEVATGTELFVLRDRTDTQVVHASFSADGSSLLTGNTAGWVTVRRTDSLDHGQLEPLFLPNDAIEITSRLMRFLADSELKASTLEENLKLANKCNRYFPSYEGLAVAGASLYHLGRYEEAIEALGRASRLEKILYGEPDLLPYIEALLALAYFELGDEAKANEFKDEFIAECEREPDRWRNHQDAIKLKRMLEKLSAK